MNEQTNQQTDFAEQLITKQAAIDALCKAGCDSGYCGISCDDVKAIEQLPTEKTQLSEESTTNLQPTCNNLATDCISRQAAIDALAEWGDVAIENRLKNIPPAQPQLDEWCESCAEYDHETYSCPRFNRVIKTTLDDVRKDAYKHGKSKGIKKGLAMARPIRCRDCARWCSVIDREIAEYGFCENKSSIECTRFDCFCCWAEPYKGEQ